jgi:hypothetical protein
MDTPFFTSSVHWREFTDRDAYQDRLSAELASVVADDSADW